MSATISNLLDDKSYHIEFNGHLTNHAKHAVVALSGLGIPDHKVAAYYRRHARQTPYGYPLEPCRKTTLTITEENFDSYLGKRREFAAYCSFFDKLIETRGVDSVIVEYMPKLLPGWAAAFTHATIHLGWGLDSGNRWMVTEGLAYMAFSYITCHPERLQPPSGSEHDLETPWDTLTRIAATVDNDRSACKSWLETVTDLNVSDVEILPELRRSGLQYRIARTMKEGHPLIYQAPKWAFTKYNPDRWQQFYYLVSIVYLSKPGNFILLHLLTSLYAMENISERLSDNIKELSQRCYWVGMLCILFSEDLLPSEEMLAAQNEIFLNIFDSDGETTAQEASWHQLVSRAYLEEEEHNPKLVYLMKKLWKRFGYASVYRHAAFQFTATPELPSTFEEAPKD